MNNSDAVCVNANSVHVTEKLLKGKNIMYCLYMVKIISHTRQNSLLWKEASSTWLHREMREACLCKEQVHNLRAPASSATRCNSHSFTPLSHSLSVAWQSLPHQASRDSLPVPALHLHSPGWCHGRFSSWSRATEHTPRLAECAFACVCVYVCASISVPGSNINQWTCGECGPSLLALVMTSSVRQLWVERHIKQTWEEEDSGRWNMDSVPKLDYYDVFLLCFLLLQDTNACFCFLLVSVHSITHKIPSVSPYWATRNENLTSMRNE